MGEGALLPLTTENYYSREADRAYMSVSQYFNFLSCEAREVARLRGEWSPEPTDALLVGQYVHTAFEGPEAQREFIGSHPEMFTQKGTLKAQFQQGQAMIQAVRNDPFALFMLEGEHEVILTAEMFGTPWKIRVDVLNHEYHRQVDLKTARSFDRVWDEHNRRWESFVGHYRYMARMGIYDQVLNLATGENWKAFIVAVTKESPPDKMIINMWDPVQYAIDLASVEVNMPRILAVKAGEVEPWRCERCEYCRGTKRLERVIHYTEL